MCGCKCCIYAKIIHSSLLSWRGMYLKNSKIKYKKLKVENLVKNTLRIWHISKYCDVTWALYLCQSILYGKCYNLHISTVWSCTPTLEMCIAVIFQMSTYQYSWLHVVLLMVEFHWKGEICFMCKQESSSDESTKIYTREELVMMETTIYDFYTSF